MNVLIVDEIQANHKLLRSQLQAEHLTVLDAADGVEALAVLEREKIDAVISDILMPRMDGYRLCFEARRSQQLREIPFIFYTATYTRRAMKSCAWIWAGTNTFGSRPRRR